MNNFFKVIFAIFFSTSLSAQVPIEYSERRSHFREIPVFAADVTDGFTPVTGLTLTCNKRLPLISSFSSCSGSISEIGSGHYIYTLDRTEVEENTGMAIFNFTNGAIRNSPVRVRIEDDSSFGKNYLKFPSGFDNAIWTKINVTVAADVTTTWDGLSIADRITRNTDSTVLSYIRQAQGTNAELGTFLPDKDQYYHIVELKEDNHRYVAFSDFSSALSGFRIDLQTGETNIFSSGYDTSTRRIQGKLAQALGNGWWRVYSIAHHNSTGGQGLNMDIFHVPNMTSSLNYGSGNGQAFFAARAKIGYAKDLPDSLYKMIMAKDVISATSSTVVADHIDINVDGYVGRELCVYGIKGTTFGRTQCRCVTSANTGTRTLTISPNWTYTPTAYDRYTIEGSCDTSRIIDGTITASAISNDAITSAKIAASALNDKGNWNVGKTGYSLTQTFPTNFATLSINGSGHVSRVTTCDTVTDKANYVLSTAGNTAIKDAIWQEDLSTYTNPQAGYSLSQALQTTLTCEVTSDE